MNIIQKLPPLTEGWSWNISNGYVSLRHDRKNVHSKSIIPQYTFRPEWMIDQNITEDKIIRTAHEVLAEAPEQQRKDAIIAYYKGTYRPGYETKPPTIPGTYDLNLLLPQLKPDWAWNLVLFTTAELRLEHDGFFVAKGTVRSLPAVIDAYGVLAEDITPEPVVKTANRILSHEYPKYLAKQAAKHQVARWNTD